jgi:hypothetical protein
MVRDALRLDLGLASPGRTAANWRSYRATTMQIDAPAFSVQDHLEAAVTRTTPRAVRPLTSPMRVEA